MRSFSNFFHLLVFDFSLIGIEQFQLISEKPLYCIENSKYFTIDATRQVYVDLIMEELFR